MSKYTPQTVRYDFLVVTAPHPLAMHKTVVAETFHAVAAEREAAEINEREGWECAVVVERRWQLADEKIV